MADQGIINADISISEDDLNMADFLNDIHRPTVGKELHFLNGTSITLGIPLNPQNQEYLMIPNKPHLFQVDNLYIADGKYTAEAINAKPELQISPNHPNLIDIGKTVVLFAHGKNENNNWVYENGQSITDTVRAYNDHAKINNLPVIEVIVSCNTENSDFNSIFNRTNQTDTPDVQVGEFGIDDQNMVTAYAVGEIIQSGGTYNNGEPSLYVSSSKPMLNLYHLLTYKEVSLK